LRDILDNFGSTIQNGDDVFQFVAEHEVPFATAMEGLQLRS
jgi:hypothetical protein